MKMTRCLDLRFYLADRGF